MIKKLLVCAKFLNRQRNLLIKRIKSYIKLALLNRKKKERTALNPEQYHFAVILMNDQGIGDAIVTSYLIKSLRGNGLKVYVVVEKRIAFLFEKFITVDGVLLYDKKKGIKQFRKQLNGLNIDVAIDLVDKGHNSLRRSQIILAINPVHSIGFNQEKNKLYDTSIFYNQYTSHISIRSQKILQLLNIETDLIKYYVNIPIEAHNSVEAFISSYLSLGKNIIIFNPYGSNVARSFSDKQIETILSFLSQYNNCVTIIVGEPNKIKHIEPQKNIIINPLTSFFETVALIKFATLVITVDTSIVHVSSIYDKKMLCIYNNRIIDNKFVNNFVWGPNYSNALQIFTADNLGTGLGDPIANLDPSVVIEKLKEELEKLELNKALNSRTDFEKFETKISAD
ncbi:glycosyltransferase family 9 protein [Gilliamella sp. B2969]|uniref:glycosyltransferase family 9 protein n=1 Tax=Gilliamella sp. B2969 TaxID=2818021 RepID=UPI00226A1F40|nr:glycosyltransferase family 9 protein [Gilliamella sp. B2969]MCX8729473.1 glycosyltransferase family 9 protein [Gilliamella sp. B2969]